jgi:hypothetical protein
MDAAVAPYCLIERDMLGRVRRVEPLRPHLFRPRPRNKKVRRFT